MNITSGQNITNSSHQTDTVLKILKDVTRKYNVGKKEINVSFDALHGVQPNQEDIIKLIQKRNPSARKERILKASREINAKSHTIQKDNTDYDSKSALSIIRDETNDELVKSEIDKQIRKRKMVNSKKEYLRVHVSTEGSRLSGSTAMIERRYGSTNIFGFGDLFQAVQLELSPICRKKYQGEIALAISEIALAFSKKFSTKEKYLSYKKANSTPVDKAREKGCLYFNAIGRARRGNNTLKMNSDFRRWLDVRKGDSVSIYKVDNGKISSKPILALKVSNSHYTEKKVPYPLFNREINKAVIVCKG